MTETELVKAADLKKENFLHIYFSKIPDAITFYKVFPSERNEEIEKLKNEAVKKEKYWGWKLLEYGLTNSLGLSLQEAAPEKHSDGKWYSHKCYFSISHSHGMVAVAVSNKSTGIDIEEWNAFENKKYNLEGMTKKFLSEEELHKYTDATEKRKFLELWTKKESTFKENPDEKGFYSKNIELNEKRLLTKYQFFGEKEYCYSVCSDFISLAEFTAVDKKLIQLD